MKRMNEIFLALAALVIPTEVTAFHTIRSITVTEETPASFAPASAAHLNPTGAISTSSHPTMADDSTSHSISYEPTILPRQLAILKHMMSYQPAATHQTQYSVHPEALLQDQLQLPS